MSKGHEITRRSLLVGLAAASAAVAAPGGARAAVARVTENPALAPLAQELAAAVAELAKASEDYRACIAYWSPRWPAVPAAITYARAWGDEDKATTLTNEWIRGTDGKAVAVMSVARIDEAIAAITKALRRVRKTDKPFGAWSPYSSGVRSAHEWTVELEQLNDIRAIAAEFEAEKARVLQASRYVAIKARRLAAYEAVEHVVGGIMAERPATIEGLIIQAQAMQAWGDMPLYHQITRVINATWGTDFASSLLRIAERDAAA